MLLEETMEKSWGIYIPQVQSDISDKLQNHLTGKFYIPITCSFQEAKRKFKTEFLKNQLQLHHGNISQLARFVGLDRRSVHRAIKGLDLHLDRLVHHQDVRIKSTIQSAGLAKMSALLCYS